MSNDSHRQSQRDRSHFMGTLPDLFPGVEDVELENAYNAARRAIAPSEDPEQLKAKMHEILN